MKHSNPVLRHLCEYGMITLGCAIYALSFNWFFAPNNISMGVLIEGLGHFPTSNF